MVLPASPPHPPPDPSLALLVDELNEVLELAAGSVLVLVQGATMAALGPVVRQLRQTWPNLEVRGRATDLTRVPADSTVLVVPRRDELEWLNRERPIISRRGLRVILWCSAELASELPHAAPDALSWITAALDCPAVPAPATIEAIAQAERLGLRGVAWRGGAGHSGDRRGGAGHSGDRRGGAGHGGAETAPQWAAAIPSPWATLPASAPHGLLVERLRAAADSWVVVEGPLDRYRLRNLSWALTEVGRYGRLLLAEPEELSDATLGQFGFWPVNGATTSPEEALSLLEPALGERALLVAALLSMNLDAMRLVLELVERETVTPSAVLDMGVAELVERAQGSGLDVSPALELLAGKVGSSRWTADEVEEHVHHGRWAEAAEAAEGLGERIPAEHWRGLLYDAFISYAHADGEWVHPLAENLHAAGLKVFLDEWEIGPGDSIVARVDQGLAQSRAGVLVLSPMWLEQPRVQQEYRALMVRFLNQEARLIPVLYQDIRLPPLLADIAFADFRHAQGVAYQRQLERLLRALRGERPGPPARRPGPDAGSATQPDRASLASSYHHLGTVAQDRGDYDHALEWYSKSLAINDELGNPAGMAQNYHQLGMVAQERGDYESALDWYKRSLAIFEDFDDRSGMAQNYHQLGMVAQQRGDYDGALDWYKRSLAIDEELGNRAGMASSIHRLGNVAQLRGDYDGALDWYKRSLAIDEELGNRAGMASSLSQLGILRTAQKRVEEAIPLTLRSLAIRRKLDVPQLSIDLLWLGQQREALGEARFNAVLAQHLDAEAAKNVLELLGREGGRR